jgi:FKBP-type peptidyl-prolyl cis-trans isomerase
VKRRWWVIGGVVLIAAASGAGFWWWQVSQSQPDEVVNSRGGSIVMGEQGNGAVNKPSDDLSEVAAPLTTGQVSGAAAEGSGAASNSIPINGAAGKNNDNAQSGGQAAHKLPEPSEFEVYEKYKNEQAALFVDIVAGTGPEVKMGSTVMVHYRGWLTNGKVFDESYARGEPYGFVEGEHRVILGWEQGLFGMKTGGKRRLVIPPVVGYGDKSNGPIPAGSLLIFDVELIGVK